MASGEFYVPDISVVSEQSSSNRQGRDAHPISRDEAQRIVDVLVNDATRGFESYEWMLNEAKDGGPRDETRHKLSRELARIGLPLSTYTEWYWKIDLHNLMHFVRLRADRHAQFEIRAYARVIADIMRQWVPNAYDAFQDYRLNTISLSAMALGVMKRLLRGEKIDQAESGLSKSEWRELIELVRPDDI